MLNLLFLALSLKNTDSVFVKFDCRYNNGEKMIGKDALAETIKLAKVAEAGIKKIQDKNIVLLGGKESQLYHGYMTWRRNKKDGKLPHEPDPLAAMRYAINSHRPISQGGEKAAEKRAARRKRTNRRRGSFI